MEYLDYDEFGYSEISAYVDQIKQEVETLDTDTLIEEMQDIKYHIIGKELEKVEYLIFKVYADEDLEEEEVQFLRNIFLIYHCPCAIVVDEQYEDEDE